MNFDFVPSFFQVEMKWFDRGQKMLNNNLSLDTLLECQMNIHRKINLTLSDFGSFLEKFSENSDHVYWLSSPDFKKIEYISPAYERIWGRSRDQLYSNPDVWIDFLHPRWSRYLVIDFSHPWPKSTRQRAKCLAPTVLRPARCPERASVCLPQ